MNDRLEARIHAAYDSLASSDPATVREAARTLEAIGVAALPAMIKALQDEQLGEKVWLQILDHLWTFGGEAAPAAGDLIKFLQPPYVGHAHGALACYTLGKIGAAAIPLMIERLPVASESEWEKWKSSIIPKLPADITVPELCRSLCSTDGNVQLRGLESLRWLGETAWAATPDLCDFILRTAPLNRVARQAAVETLVDVMRPEDIPHVRQLVEHANPHIRLSALQVVWRTDPNSTELISLFLAMLKDPDPLVRIEAAACLQAAAAGVSHQIWAQELEHALDSASDLTARQETIVLTARNYRSSAARSTRVEQLLKRILEQPTSGFVTRRHVAATLLCSNDRYPLQSALDEVRLGLNDPEDPSRQEYLRAIQAAGSRVWQLAFTVVQCVADEKLRHSAVEALVALDYAGDQIVQTLLEYLQSGSPALRGTAALCLRRLRAATTETMTALARALSDDQEEVREAVAYALGDMGKAAANTVSLLDRLAISTNSLAAVTALGQIRTGEATAALWEIYHSQFNELKDEAHDQLAEQGLLPKRAET